MTKILTISIEVANLWVTELLPLFPCGQHWAASFSPDQLDILLKEESPESQHQV